MSQIVKENIVYQTMQRISGFKGFGKEKINIIKESLETSIEEVLRPNSSINRITNPQSVFEYLKNNFIGDTQESFGMILVNIRNEIIDHRTLYVGTLNQTLIHPREIFKFACERSAGSIILYHTHPSGSTKASNDDVRMTKKLIEIGNMMDIKIIDHIILTTDGLSYSSMKEEGLI